MSDEEGPSSVNPYEALDVLRTDPPEGRRYLPQLLDQLAADDEATRLGACAAVCRAAQSLPGMAEYLTRRLVDRFEDESPSTETALAFQYLEAIHPETVSAELDSMAAEQTPQARIRTMDGTLLRANIHQPSLGDRRIGRSRMPGGDGNSRGNPVVSERDTNTEEDEVNPDSDADSEEEQAEDSSEGDSGGPSGSAAAQPGQWQPADHVPTIERQSRFDSLTILAKRARQRYGDLYRTLGEVDDEQEGVGLMLFHIPSEERRAYVAELADQLAAWSDVADHENVVTLWDWGHKPRPWSLTAYAAQRLSDRGQFDVSDAVWHVTQLANGLEYLHDSGIVHAGLDPDNIAYYDTVFEEGERQSPLLTNVGLMHVMRRYFDPTTRLDPRYAAPEYFDRQFGRIDNATDVYQLGALLYRYLTGRPPYTGGYEAVRSGVLDTTVPTPSTVDGVPAALDAVVEKAMAPQKLHRYETVTHLAHELQGIGVTEDDDI
jgi:hypothetical protein